MQIFRPKALLPHLLIVGIIILATEIVWNDLRFISINGDGFVYIIQRFRATFWNSPQSLFWLENSPFFLSNIFVPWFGAKMQSYLQLELVAILIITAVFYMTVYLVTKNIFVAASSAIIQSFSYLGNWNMYISLYAYFFDRLPSILILLPSFILLHKYLESGRIKILVLSILVYILGIGLWHWGVLLTGLFAFYPILYSLYDKRKKIIIHSLASVGYIMISQFFVWVQSIYQPGYGGSNHSLLRIIQGNGRYNLGENLDLVFRQLTYWSQYRELINVFYRSMLQYPQQLVNNSLALFSDFFYRDAIAIQPWVVAVYLFVILFTYFTLPKFRALLLAVVFATLLAFYLNLYIGQYQVEDQSGSNRYLFIPTFTLAIFWSLFLYGAIIRFKKIGLLFAIFCLIFYSFMNILVIRNHFYHSMPAHKKITATWDYIVNNQKKLSQQEEIILLGPGLGGYEAEFLNDHFASSGKMKYFSQQEEAAKLRIPQDKKKIIIGYDNQCRCVKETRLEDLKK